MAESKYAQYVRPAPVITSAFKQMKYPILFQMGREQWADSKFSTDWAYITEPVTIVEEAHTHNYDTYFIFVGGDPKNFRDFQAEIWMYLGKEHEKIVITSPTSLWVPAGLVHCPFIIKKVTQPILYMGFAMSGFDDAMPIPKESQR